ncbi:cytochrome P450 71B34-like [Mercurialis annua]|uniref:cytochrome P450 71B34-like n=1 Tax=Mercurialis annua TaxID=3986 RepID=UPI00215F14C1|nr:cytochrome P450 71B34-like [Mercurialis annua]
MAPYLIVLLLFPLLLLLLVKRKIIINGNQQLPPSPPKLPILGNLHQLGKRPHRSLCQLSKQYGPVMLLRFGNIPVVIISSAEAAEHVLKTHDLQCCTRPPLSGTRKLSYNFLDIAFAPYGEYWRRIRKLCVVELFSVKRVQSFRFVREEEVASLVSSISQSASSKNPIDLTEKIVTLVANIVFRIAFATNVEATDMAKKNRIKSLVDEAEAIFGSFCGSDYFKYVGWIIDRISGYHSRVEKIFQEMDAFYQLVIDEHLQGVRTVEKEQEEEDIVDVLLGIGRKEAGAGSIQLTKDHIKAVLMNIFLAGISTGSDSLIWAMAELVKNPKVMNKAKEEIRNVIGIKERVTERDTDELHYLKMVIKETLRLYPPVPLLLARQAISNFQINGYDVNPEMIIQINVWAIGRDPEYWKDPEEFLPERFMDSSVDFKGQNFELLPFGGGRRGCPGQYMGTVMLELVLTNLLYFFDWELPKGVEDLNMEEKYGASLVLSKMEPLRLVPVNYLQ